MKKLLFTLFFVLASYCTLIASHIESVDLTYRYMGYNNYQLQLCFYRDCSGVAEPTSVTVHCKSSCNPSGFDVTLIKQAPLNGEELTPVCPGAITTCSGGTLFGFKKFVYQANATLSPCADWTMSYTLCCRNPSNTIQNPTSTDMYIPATLNNSTISENSSPYFSDIPTAIICNGQATCIYFGCEDMDGDSLVYSMITPWRTGPGTPTPTVIYLNPYTYLQPLPSNPLVTINKGTGEVCMTPTQNLTTVFAVQVDEYRRVPGHAAYKIGSIIRDIQLKVIACTNTEPKLAGINPAATQYDVNDITYSDTACVGNSFAFNVYSHDPDIPADMLTMTYTSILYGPSWSISNNYTANPIGHFQWTPLKSDTLNNPHCFFIKIQDDNCPYLGYRSYCYCLTVVAPKTHVTMHLPHDTVCGYDPPFLMTGTPSGGTFSGQGVTGNLFVPASAGAGTHRITYSYVAGNSCTIPDTAYVVVLDTSGVKLTGLDALYCHFAGPVTLSGSPPGGWFSGQGISGNTFSPANAGIGTHMILYHFSLGNNCTFTDTAYTTVGNGSPVSFTGLLSAYCLTSQPSTLTGFPAGGTFAGNGITGNVFNPLTAGAGNQMITYSYNDGSGCISVDTAYTNVQVTIPVSIAGLAANYCIYDGVVTLAGNPGGGTFTGTGMAGNNFDPTAAGTGLHMIIYSYTAGNNCTFSDTAYTTVGTSTTVSFTGLYPSYCITDGPTSLSGSPPGGTFSGPGVTGNLFNPSAAGPGVHIITYSYTDPDQCIFSKDSIVYISLCTNSEQSVFNGNISVYPNPVTSEINIAFRNINGIAKITLDDIIGREVFNEIKNINGNEQLLCDLSKLRDGIYLLSIMTEGQDFIMKLVKSE